MRYLCCAMCFTVHIIFIHFDKHSSDLGLDTCLAPEGFNRSISGPRPKKVVHHWSRQNTHLGNLSSLAWASCSSSVSFSCPPLFLRVCARTFTIQEVARKRVSGHP